MSKAPLMPIATAVWLVENTSLTFKQIADFCKLHEVEIQGIADGEVAKGIVGYNPIIAGQLTKEEILLSSKDQARPLKINNYNLDISNDSQKIIVYRLHDNHYTYKQTITAPDDSGPTINFGADISISGDGA